MYQRRRGSRPVHACGNDVRITGCTPVKDSCIGPRGTGPLRGGCASCTCVALNAGMGHGLRADFAKRTGVEKSRGAAPTQASPKARLGGELPALDPKWGELPRVFDRCENAALGAHVDKKWVLSARSAADNPKRAGPVALGTSVVWDPERFRERTGLPRGLSNKKRCVRKRPTSSRALFGNPLDDPARARTSQNHKLRPACTQCACPQGTQAVVYSGHALRPDTLATKQQVHQQQCLPVSWQTLLAVSRQPPQECADRRHAPEWMEHRRGAIISICSRLGCRKPALRYICQ